MGLVINVLAYSILGLFLLVFALVGVSSFRFVKLENAGRRPMNDGVCEEYQFIEEGVHFLPGYRARGKYRSSQGNTYPYLCEVLRSDAGTPVFRCTAELEGGLVRSESGTISTTVQGFFRALGFTKRRHLSAWKFFGFHRRQVRQSMEEAALLPPVDGNSLPGGESLRSGSTDGELDEKGPFVVWQGVQSYGEASRQRILQSPNHLAWKFTTERESCMWNPGFRSKRLLKRYLNIAQLEKETMHEDLISSLSSISLLVHIAFFLFRILPSTKQCGEKHVK